MKPAIKRAVATLTKAKENLKRVLAAEQKACSHEHVIHSDWRASEWVGPFRARRLCLDCGLEEQASSLGNDDYYFRQLKTNGFHKVVSGDEIYRTRFPEADVDA